jgi:hypothetical protein
VAPKPSQNKEKDSKSTDSGRSTKVLTHVRPALEEVRSGSERSLPLLYCTRSLLYCNRSLVYCTRSLLVYNRSLFPGLVARGPCA